MNFFNEIKSFLESKEKFFNECEKEKFKKFLEEFESIKEGPILLPAILNKNIIYVGKNYKKCIKNIKNCSQEPDDYILGFVNEKGIFYSREDALIVSKKYNQL